jgi:hypothetical protein
MIHGAMSRAALRDRVNRSVYAGTWVQLSLEEEKPAGVARHPLIRKRSSHYTHNAHPRKMVVVARIGTPSSIAYVTGLLGPATRKKYEAPDPAPLSYRPGSALVPT